MATGALIAGTALSAGGQAYSGYEQQQEAKDQARQLSDEAGDLADIRRAETDRTVQKQKMAFIKSGITLSPDSPLLMLADTKATGYEEASRIQSKGDAQAKMIKKQGRQAFISGILGGASTGLSAIGGKS